VIYPPKPRPGDRVAVLSPASGSAGLFPHTFDLGLRRLRDELGLEPVEYPTTREVGASAEARARDLTDAFCDPGITAVLAAIGGDDQITVVPHLSPEVFRENPKPFFGYSDNTNLLHFLFSAGVVGFHGGSVMVHLGRPGRTHPASMASLRAALFDSGPFELTCPEEFGDETLDWADPANLDRDLAIRPAAPWRWLNADTVVDGTAWGGNLEVLQWVLAAGRVGDVDADILFVETSEELPSDVEVHRMLRNMGERGLLAQFRAVLVGRAKAWDFARPLPLEERASYAEAQRVAVTRTLSTYNPEAMVVFDLDIGHTDPQLVLPYGGRVRVDGPARRITAFY
jgi:muramoyltetrapeptide carboxypeptidase LdcA involved in peptidoglycan recycling